MYDSFSILIYASTASMIVKQPQKKLHLFDNILKSPYLCYCYAFRAINIVRKSAMKEVLHQKIHFCVKTKRSILCTFASSYWSRLNFYEIQDLPLFLRRFWALKRECSELHDRWKGKKRPKRKVKIEFRRDKSPNQIFVRKV